MTEEQGIAKVDMSYIVKAVMMGNSLYTNNWEKGVLYLTNLNLWFSQGEGWATIPIKNITMFGREPTGTLRMKAQQATGSPNVLIIDYLHPSSVSQEASASSIALLTGPEPVINTLKAYLQPMCGTVKKTQPFTEIDKKLLYMLYTGVTDLQKLGFLIGADTDTLTESFQKLKDQDLCNAAGALTINGLNKIKEMM